MNLASIRSLEIHEKEDALPPESSRRGIGIPEVSFLKAAQEKMFVIAYA